MSDRDQGQAGLPAPGADEVLSALDALLAVLRDRSHLERIEQRARTIREQRLAGSPYTDIVAEEQRPLIVEALTEHLDALSRAGARFRRAEAAALYVEGATMERIAELFGVTRQRVSVLLREARVAGIVAALRGDGAAEDDVADGVTGDVTSAR